MRFSYQGVNYQVDFQYQRVSKNGKSDIWGKSALGEGVNDAKIVTYCNFQVQKDGVWYGLVSSFSTKCNIDRFSKSTGRKLALAGALGHLQEFGLNKAVDFGNNFKPTFNKNFREFVWHHFFENHKEGWDIPILEKFMPIEDKLKTSRNA